MTDQWDAPLAPGACPWCSASNPPEARQCGTCGAAIAQRDDLGGVVVPGVTGVDPNLLGTPRSLASPMLRSQGTMGALNAVSHVNATLGLAAAAAILGQDTVKGMLGMKDADMERVGKPSEAALLAAEKLEREQAEAAAAVSATLPDGTGAAPSGAGPTAPAADPWRDLSPPASQSSADDPWRDLPAPATPTTDDPWRDLAASAAEPPPDPATPPAADPWSDLPAGADAADENGA